MSAETRYWVDRVGQLHRTIAPGHVVMPFTVEWFASPILGWVSLDEPADGAYQGATPEEVAKRHGWEEWSRDSVNSASWCIEELS